MREKKQQERGKENKGGTCLGRKITITKPKRSRRQKSAKGIKQAGPGDPVKERSFGKLIAPERRQLLRKRNSGK